MFDSISTDTDQKEPDSSTLGWAAITSQIEVLGLRGMQQQDQMGPTQVLSDAQMI